MIDDAALLQADVTLIVGILIFLTIAPISQDVKKQITERKMVIFSTYVTIGFFALSRIFSSWNIFTVPVTSTSPFLLPAGTFFWLGSLVRC